MLILILAIVIALVAWSLHLMQQAIDRSEFSLMLAGTLVAFSAAAMVAVYFLMGNYIGYVTGITHTTSSRLSSANVAAWVLEVKGSGEPTRVSVLYPDVRYPDVRYPETYPDALTAPKPIAPALPQ